MQIANAKERVWLLRWPLWPYSMPTGSSVRQFRREARTREDIDTVVVDSLKALDPEWPIREATFRQRPFYEFAP